jgi:hypothetical protein
MIESRGNRDAVVAAQHDLAIDRLDFENIRAVVSRDGFDDKLAGVLRHDALDQAASGVISAGKGTWDGEEDGQ